MDPIIYKEINLCGIYVPPFFLCLVAAAIVYAPLHRLWDRLFIQRWVWNRPLVELALFILVLTAIVFIL
jgi:hypothetical protein